MLTRRVVAVAGMWLLACPPAEASGIGHYDGGLLNVRDYFLPAQGVHGFLYNHYYSTNRFNDAQGEQVDVVTVHPGPGPGVPLNLEVDVQAYVAAPTLILVRELNSKGFKIGASITPTLANKALDAAVSNTVDVSGTVHGAGFGIGDLFVRPAWLEMTTSRWDLGGSYGFYAPIGEYDTQHVPLPPPFQPIKTAAPSNLGLGFWTQQFQGVIGWYPRADRTTVLMSALTYEISGKQDGFDRTPGADLTLNWGASHDLAVREDQAFQFELGVAGYNTWQMSDDTGADARSGRAEVRAAGWELGLTHLPTNLWVNLHVFYDYTAKLRFQGNAYSVSFGTKL
jgi:hypothetical protein